MNDNEFYFDPQRISDNPNDTTHTIKRQAGSWTLDMIFATEPELAIIAIEAACSRTLWKAARKTARETAMQKADQLIGEDASDPRLRDKAAWDFFNDYIFELLRL